MTKALEQFQDFLDSTRKKFEEEIIYLKADNRTDEANFIKIKLNIYGIANSFYGNAKRNSPHQLKDDYLKRFEQSQLEKNWENAYKEAEKYGDDDRMLIEKLKLETLNEINSTFLQIIQDGGIQ